MSKSFVEARKSVLNYLSSQLIGPAQGEEEQITDAPHKRYLMGTLFPRAACMDETDDDVEQDTTTEALSNDFKPSSMAFSFAVTHGTKISLEVSAAKYKKQGQDTVWTRKPLIYFEDIVIENTVRTTIFDKSATLDITVRPYTKGSIVTIALSNKENSGDRLNPAQCLYQCGLNVTLIEGRIREYPTSDRFKLDDEQKDLNLIYRKRIPWAVGHGVAVDWELDEHQVPISIKTQVMPFYEVKDFSTDLDTEKYSELNDDILSISRIVDHQVNKATLLADFTKLVNAYDQWIEELKSEELDSVYNEAKKRIISRLDKVSYRLKKAIELLDKSEDAFTAFRLANKAMLMQMIHADKNYAGESKKRDWGYQPPDYDSIEVKQKYKWRPFQLAFQLLILESIIPDPKTNHYSETRDDVDLLWFPTGGGKTEAYLVVAAWEMIYRRLTKGPKGGGTAVIKRYTLRLLTSQQFQRAGTLICALDVIRREDSRLGSEPFSLGLWAGQGSTPNDYKSAHEKYSLARQDHEPENVFQLHSCPWCGTEIMPKTHCETNAAYGIKCNEFDHFSFYCPSIACEFHEFLPIQIIDEALYKNPPSLLIGTVDKFARLTWKEDACKFFGDKKVLPPSLIIQDELHLISGPLGTIAGIYEAGFDSIIEYLGVKPKVIAATATIRAASQQCLRIFGRNVNIFPPSGTDQSDSFFSKEEKEKPGRLYVGIMPSGHTNTTALVHTAAATLQAPYDLGFDGITLDSYWSLPIYHNSRRELGKSMTLARDDIPERIKIIAEEARKIDWVEELSSGVPGTKIPEVLANLNKPVPNTIDILPCTNMISVGVDISRLGMMIIAGQPKATAEYIQASSRVGRNKQRPPGIVFTLYSATKPRDRSHYETFKNYHQALYRYVEPTSVTPWAMPALERALHASFIALIRVSGHLRKNTNARFFDSNHDEFKKLKKIFKNRIALAMQGLTESNKEEVYGYLDDLITSWDERVNAKVNQLTHYESQNSGKQFHPLIKPFEQEVNPEAWKTLNSMRNVDTETNLYIRGESMS